MIKFFRKIRYTLMQTGKSSKYFQYAIGEIILVVIGILIALQINNWNELRKSNLQEQSALENIHRDFIKNKEALKAGMASSQLIMDNGTKILNHTGHKQKPESEDEFNKWLNNVFNSDPFYPQNGFLDDLLSSGKLGIFKNVELRNLLSSWKPKVDVLEERFKSLNINEDLVNAYILENGSWLNADKVLDESRNVTFPQSGFEVDNRNLLQSLFFENLIENLVISADNYYSMEKETLILLDKIINMLESEMSNTQ